MSADSFVIADYVVFALMLVVSTTIGFYYAWVSRGQRSASDFLTAGRTLTALPVSISLTATFMSSITVLSNPAEVYRYGAIFAYFSVGYIMSMLVVSEVLLPVFYKLKITSAYEYLELRFNRAARLLGTALFIVSTVLYTGVVIYGPALALNQITHMELWGGIFSTGLVCTLYCTLGGLKAVVWTDVFQIGIMLAGYMSVIIKSVALQGGVHTIISHSWEGGRLNFLDFDINPLRRHTFWTIIIGGTVGWIAANGANQAQVQRFISCKSITHARVALYIHTVGLSSFLICSVFAGMCLFSLYQNCDPWTAGKVSALDQLIPYLVIDILSDYPGMPGLFFAAVYSGSLSTVSSSINALAAVTLEDLIKPHTNMSEKHLFWMSKGLIQHLREHLDHPLTSELCGPKSKRSRDLHQTASLLLGFFYGILCISFAGLSSLMGGMMQAAVIIGGTFGGPLLGLFTLGILCPRANSKGGLAGLISGLVASLCLSIGYVLHPPPPEVTRPLPLTTVGCNSTTIDSVNWTSTAQPTESTYITAALVHTRIEHDEHHLLADNWHSPSYLYFSVIGSVTAFSVGLIVSMLTGGCRTRVESRFILLKEDTVSYHVFTFFKDKVTRSARMLDRERRVGNSVAV